MRTRSQPEQINLSVAEIILAYHVELRGFANYYALALNAKREMNKMAYLCWGSLLKILASKHKSTVSKTVKRLKTDNEYTLIVKGEKKTRGIYVFRLKNLKPLPMRDAQIVQELLDRYVTLWEQTDIPGLVAFLREDAWFTMPPFPLWYQGRAAIATLFQTHFFTPSLQWRLLPTRANGSPAFGLYRREALADNSQLVGLLVLGMEGEQIGSLVAFLDVASFTSFGLPPTFV